MCSVGHQGKLSRKYQERLEAMKHPMLQYRRYRGGGGGGGICITKKPPIS